MVAPLNIDKEAVSRHPQWHTTPHPITRLHTMPAPLNVDREQVRMLVLAVGVTEAAKQTGIDINTVKQWSARGKWLAHLRAPKPTLPKSMQPVNVTGVTNPADALVNTLAERKKETKLGLSKWASKAATKLGDMKGEQALHHAGTAKLTADVMAKVWPEERTDGGMSLAFFSLSIGQESAEKPVEGRVIDEEHEDNHPTT